MATTELLSTEQLAMLFHVKPASIRSALCRNGHYFGLVPIRRPNRFLGWRRDEAERLLNGESIEPASSE